jgi:beta-lactamase class D
MRYLKNVMLSLIYIIYLGGCAKNTLPNVESTSSTSAEPSASTSQEQTPAPVPEETVAPEETAIPLNELISADDLAAYFGEYNVATMLLSDGVSQVTYNEPLSAKRYSPYSTYKIVNSLISLEEKVVSIDDSLRKWDGTQYSLPNFNQDQDMASAMKYSCVWYYQQLAREVGKTAMQNYLDEIGYGNMDISGGIDTFWLGSSLLISPQEQLDLIIRLYNNELPFSQDNMEYVKSIMRQEGYSVEIHGKTGSSGNGQGWFVGYAILNEKPYFFATYIEGKNVEGPLVRDKTAEILNKLLSE